MKKYGERLCDYAPACFFMWAKDYKIEIAESDGVLVIRSRSPRSESDNYSLLGDRDGIIRVSEQLLEEGGGRLSLCALTPTAAQTIREHYGDAAVLTSEDYESDYLYMASDLRDFPGKKYSQKRNHIHAFLRENEDYSIEDINESDMAELGEFYKEYRSEEEDDSQTAHAEGHAALRVIKNYFSLPLDGIILRAGGRIVGLSIAESIGDTLFIHIEKAEHEVRGAYPMLVREMVLRHPEVTYVNREEDDGDDGLRKSKRSYHPTSMVVKYNAEINIAQRA